MRNFNHEMTLALEARNQSIKTIADIGNLFGNPQITATAKLATAHAISHLALAAAHLTRLYQVLAHPGAKP